jgi:hypothetical protein
LNRPAKVERCLLLDLDLAALTADKEHLFSSRLFRFRQLADVGLWADAEAMWQLVNPMGRGWSRSSYRPGEAESGYVLFRFWQGELREDDLALAEQLAMSGKNRSTVRNLHRLRGEWRSEQGQWALAAESLHEAVRMAREIGQLDVVAEAMLSLAKFHLGQLPAARDVAEQLAKAKEPPHRTIAELWLAIGDREQAKKHALAAYKRDWADGEPYVFRYGLNKARALLEQLGADVPDLPPYDPTRDEKLPWEDELTAAIGKLRAETEAKQAAETGEKE